MIHIDRYRNPAYTGENRCLPCTITNVAIAGLGSLALGLLAPPLGVFAFLGAVLTIYLRGYLVPGTPTFTRRYFPDWLLAVFGKTDPRPASIDAATTLVDAGVLRDEAADLVLDPDFAAAWAERVAEVDADRGGASDAPIERLDATALAELTGLDAGRLDVRRYGDAVVADLGTERIGRWESRAAFVADVAAARELDDRVPRWRSIPLAARSELLGALRLFLERCPACDARVELDHEVVRSCCRDYDVVAASCSGCGSRLLEADVDPDALSGGADPPGDDGSRASVETH
jgi:hypothetical protein